MPIVARPMSAGPTRPGHRDITGSERAISVLAGYVAGSIVAT